MEINRETIALKLVYFEIIKLGSIIFTFFTFKKLKANDIEGHCYEVTIYQNFIINIVLLKFCNLKLGTNICIEF